MKKSLEGLTEEEKLAYWRAVKKDKTAPIHLQAIAQMEIEHLTRPARHRFKGMKQV